MGAHESMEHAEHAEHASGSNKKIALLIAVIALFLALSETLGKGAQTEVHQQERRGLEPVGVLPGQEHPPHRGAGDRRSRPSSAWASMGDDAAKAALEKQIDDWKKTAARYRSEPETGEGSEATGQARQAGRAASAISAMAKYHHYEIASAAFQIGIVLASATIITGMIVLAWVSGLLAVAGIAIHRDRPVRAASVHLHVELVMRACVTPRSQVTSAAAPLASTTMVDTSLARHSRRLRRSYRASCTLLRKRWISRSVRDDQPSPSPRRISRIRSLIGSTRAAALARIARMNS